MTLAKRGLIHFAIDAKASLFAAQAFASGIVSVIVHGAKFAIRDFVRGSEFLPEEMQKASVPVTINAESLEITDEVSSSDRRKNRAGYVRRKCWRRILMHGSSLEKTRFGREALSRSGSPISERGLPPLLGAH